VRPRARAEEPEWAVWLTLAIALLLGAAVEAMVLGRTETANAAGSTLAYPASWVPTTDDNAAFAAADLNGGGLFGARVAVHEVERSELVPASGRSDSAGGTAGRPAPAGTIVDAANAWTLRRRETLSGYRVLEIRPAQASGREAAQVEYAYLAGAGQGVAPSAMPGLMRAVDTLVESRGRYYILTYAAEASDFDRLTQAGFPRLQSVAAGLLDSWRVP
jgi:hypothetical protein